MLGLGDEIARHLGGIRRGVREDEISLGPAIMSMSTWPNTSRFAAATYALPGPQILSTAGIDAVPYAIAATACAPPTRYRRETPAT